MKTYHFPRKIFATALCVSLLLGASSCKKQTVKEKGSRDILESDPFFETGIFEMKFPIDETKKLDYKSVNQVRLLGEKVLANYNIQYEIPEALEYSDDFKWEDYNRQGTAMFSLEGEYLGDMTLEAGNAQCLTVDDKGKLAALNMVNSADFQTIRMEIIFCDDAGKTVEKLSLPMPPSGELQYVSFLQFLPDGKIAIQSTYSAPVYVYDENGKYLFSIFAIDRGVGGEIFVQNGKYYAFSMPTDLFGTIDYYIHEIDMTTGVMMPGKKAKGIVDITQLTYAEDGVYTSTPNGISKFDPVSGEMEEVLDWNQTDINHSILASVKSFPVNEKEIHAVAREFSKSFIEDKYYVLNLNRAKKNPHAGKKIMYVGGLDLSTGFYDYMYAYNADPSHSCRIEATDYAYSLEDGTMLDEHFYTNITSRINLMLLSGDAPDILVNFAGYDQYASDAMLVDLNTYMNGAKGLNRDEYFDNIFRSMEINGKLYYIPMSFSLKGYMTNTRYIKADTNWTFDDLDQAAGALPKEMLLLPPTESTDLLKTFMGSDLTTYMDYANKKVNFNSKGMVRVLEEVKKYATKEDLSDRTFLSGVASVSSYGGLILYDGSENPGFGNKPVVKICDYLKNGLSAMMSVNITDLNDYSLFQGVIDGKGKLVGYPTLQGNGVLAQPGESMAIFAGSPYKDEAWDVIRSFFTSEAQQAVTMGMGRRLPLKRSAYDEKTKAEKEKIAAAYVDYQKDAAQNENCGMILYPVKDGQIGELREIIENVRCSYHTDEAVMDIILEEAPGYFKDSRSPEEVLKNIDNRALRIVQER